MIRFSRIDLVPLQAWLTPVAVAAMTAPPYRLRVWREAHANFGLIKDEVIAYVQEALDDARKRIRKGFEDPLSPFTDEYPDPAANYPEMLHRNTLQGYLGETFAGLAVEHFGAFGHDDWEVPAFLFRIHSTEFQHLALINEKLRAGGTHSPDDEKEKRLGRTGDDALAFRIGADGKITDLLTLEAKCLIKSNTAIIEDAHASLTKGTGAPSGVLELIELLSEYDTPDANEWRQRLLTFYRDSSSCVRRDGLAYLTGNSPKVPPTRLSWLDDTKPHSAYAGGRGLEAMEFQFEKMTDVVDILYRGK